MQHFITVYMLCNVFFILVLFFSEYKLQRRFIFQATVKPRPHQNLGKRVKSAPIIIPLKLRSQSTFLGRNLSFLSKHSLFTELFLPKFQCVREATEFIWSTIIPNKCVLFTHFIVCAPIRIGVIDRRFFADEHCFTFTWVGCLSLLVIETP